MFMHAAKFATKTGVWATGKFPQVPTVNRGNLVRVPDEWPWAQMLGCALGVSAAVSIVWVSTMAAKERRP